MRIILEQHANDVVIGRIGRELSGAGLEFSLEETSDGRAIIVYGCDDRGKASVGGGVIAIPVPGGKREISLTRPVIAAIRRIELGQLVLA